MNGSQALVLSEEPLSKSPCSMPSTSLTSQVANISAQVETALFRASAKSHKDRFESVQAFAKALQHVSGNYETHVTTQGIMFGFDALHTRHNPFEQIINVANVSLLQPKWVSVPTGDRIHSSPAVANGIVYVGSMDSKLYAFEAMTGKPIWSAPTGNPIWSSPAVADGIVYVGSYDSKLYAFSLPETTP